MMYGINICDVHFDRIHAPLVAIVREDLGVGLEKWWLNELARRKKMEGVRLWPSLGHHSPLYSLEVRCYHPEKEGNKWRGYVPQALLRGAVRLPLSVTEKPTVKNGAVVHVSVNTRIVLVMPIATPRVDRR
jgi:hypothetical protein